MDIETNAEIRNKLQAALTALETVKNNKTAPDNIVNAALKDLAEVLKIIDRLESAKDVYKGYADDREQAELEATKQLRAELQAKKSNQSK